MYATKRRRRSLKSNNKVPVLAQKSHDVCNGGGSSSSLKSNPSKRHRERLNTELERLASLLPFEANILSKLDKLSILRLSASYLRIKSYFQAIQQHEAIYSSYDSAPSGINHQHVTKPLDHFPFDPSLLRTDSILKALNGFVLVLTRDGDVFYASSNVEEFLGFHQSDVIHQKVCELIHSEDRDELEKRLSLTGNHQRSVSSEHSVPEHFQTLERSLTVRFRCLLDNTSGFLRFEVRGRMGVLHGQNFPSGDIQLGLLAICTPFGPAMPEAASRDSMFKSKHKLDFTLINIDPKGKSVLGYEEDSSPNRHFYNWIHPDDVQYAASAHRELKNTSSCGLLAYRVAAKANQWQWLQSSMRTIFKSGKPDHVTATHRPLQEEEGRDLLSKRSSVTKLDDLEDHERNFSKDESLVAGNQKTPKTKKRASPSTRDCGPHMSGSQNRRNKTVHGDNYSSAYGDAPSLPGTLNYCTNPYSTSGVIDPGRLFSAESFLPYSQFGSSCYSSLPALPESVVQPNALQNGAGILESARTYDFFAYPDNSATSGDYLKNYYKGMKVFLPTMDSVPRLTNNYSQYSDTSASSYYAKTHSAWIPHHRKSVVVWNGMPGYHKGHDDGDNGYTHALPSAHCSSSIQDENEEHLHAENMRKPTSLQSSNFSIAEATNTLLN